MKKIKSESIAEKIVELLADGRISHDQWRLWIPRHLTQQEHIVVANAKHLADGINEMMDREEIGIPPHMSLDYLVRQNDR